MNASVVVGNQIGLIGTQPAERASRLKELIDADAVLPAWSGSATSAIIAGGFLNARDASRAIITNASISKTQAEMGGVVSVNETARFLCSACNFTSNSAYYTGAALVASGTSYVDIRGGSSCSKNYAAFGGALGIFDSVTAKLEDFSCDHNQAITFGGCLRGDGSANIAVASGSFRANTASNGGFAFVGGRSRFSLAKSLCDSNLVFNVVHPNITRSFGGCFSAQQSSVVIADCLFSNNSAVDGLLIGRGGSGGGVAFMNTNSVTVRNVVFTQNWSSDRGGGVYLRNGSLVMNDTVARLNVASQGGFAFLDGTGRADSVVQNITRLLCQENLATNSDSPWGGCLFLSLPSRTISAISDSSFLRNNAQGAESSGGAIFVQSIDDSGGCTFNNITLTENTAMIAGGGVAIPSIDYAVFNDTFFRKNKGGIRGGGLYFGNGRLIMIRASAQSNLAYRGGFAFLIGNFSTEITALMCEDNIALTDNVTPAIGGCLHFYPFFPGPISVNDSVFVRNKAQSRTSRGGAIYLYSPYSNARCYFRNLTAIKNEANSAGGGMCLLDVKSATLVDVAFLNNWSGDRGGGIYAENGSISIQGALASSNIARLGGFASFFDEEISTDSNDMVADISRLYCEGNIAANNVTSLNSGGGCLSSIYLQMTVIRDSVFIRNEADGSFAFGGSMFLNGAFKSIYELRNLTVTESFSEYVGGGLHVQSPYEIMLVNSNFSRNSAGHRGVDISYLFRTDSSRTTFFLVNDTSFTDGRGTSLYMDFVMQLRVVFTRCRWTSVSGRALALYLDRDVAVKIADSQFLQIPVLFLLESLTDLQGIDRRPTFAIVNTTFRYVGNRSIQLIASQSVLLEISGSTFENVSAPLDTSVILLTQEARLKISNSWLRSVGGRALVELSGLSIVTAETMEISGNSTFEQGPFLMASNNATLVLRNITVANTRSRCGILACIESAASVSIDNVTIQKSSCLKGNSLLSAYSIDCGVIVTTAPRISMNLRGLNVAGFPSWILFALVSNNGSLEIARISATGATGGGLVHVVSTDGCGRVNAQDLSASAGSFSNWGSLLRMEYIQMNCIASNMLAANLTRVTLIFTSMSDSKGGIISLARSSLAAGVENTTRPSIPLRVNIQGVTVTNVSSNEGAGVLLCSGSLWRVSVQDVFISNVTATGPGATGGAANLEGGCQVSFRKLSNSGTVASSGGFATVKTGSVLQLRDAKISKSLAVGQMGNFKDIAGFVDLLSGNRRIALRSVLLARQLKEGTVCADTIKILEQILGKSGDSMGALSRRSVARLGVGGVISADSSCSIMVSDSRFELNFAVESGGVVHIQRGALSSSVTASVIAGLNVTAIGNAAPKGGVQYNDFGATAIGFVDASKVGMLIDAKVNSTTSDNCARFGPNIATAPKSLIASFPSGNIRLLSGSFIPAVSVRVLDSFNQPFLDASFFSMILTARGNASIAGRVNAIGVLGEGTFPNSSVRFFGSPGKYYLDVSTDGVFAEYPTSLRSTLELNVMECPPGSYVEEASRACEPCSTGRFSAAAESSSCLPVPAGFFTIDGVTLLACTVSDAEISGREAGVALRQQQCGSAAFPVIGVALGVSIPVCAIALAGFLGIRFHQRKLKEALKSRPWLVQSKDVHRLRKIGEGACGEVWLCKHRESIVCVKQIRVAPPPAKSTAPNATLLDKGTVRRSSFMLSNKTDVYDRTRTISGTRKLEDETAQLEEEIELHLTLRHPNIVLCMGAVLEESHVGLLTEFMHLGVGEQAASNSSLHMVSNDDSADYLFFSPYFLEFQSLDTLITNQAFPLANATRIKFMKEISAGLRYLHLHNPPLLHCDLKSANVLVSEDLVCKLADFGFSSLKESATMDLDGQPIGTLLSMACQLFFLSHPGANQIITIFSFFLFFYSSFAPHCRALKRSWDVSTMRPRTFSRSESFSTRSCTEFSHLIQSQS
jgi:predicted outer membrane repeat protein